MNKFKLFRYLLKFVSITNLRRLYNFIRHYIFGLVKSFEKHHTFLLGGGIAFSVFVCIIPIVLIIFSVLGSVLDSIAVENQIKTLIETFVPYPDYAVYAEKILFSMRSEVVEFKNTAAIIGGIGLFFAASGLFGSLRIALNSIFGVAEEKNALVGKLRDFGMVILVLIFIILLIFGFPLLDYINQIAQRVNILSFLKIDLAIEFIISLASVFIIFGMFYIFYRFIPYKKLDNSVPLISAVWAALFWVFARELFGYYLFNIANFNKIYGTYAFIVVIAFWIYYSSVLFVIGAEIGMLYYKRIKLKEK